MWFINLNSASELPKETQELPDFATRSSHENFHWRLSCQSISRFSWRYPPQLGGYPSTHPFKQLPKMLFFAGFWEQNLWIFAIKKIMEILFRWSANIFLNHHLVGKCINTNPDTNFPQSSPECHRKDHVAALSADRFGKFLSVLGRFP